MPLRAFGRNIANSSKIHIVHIHVSCYVILLAFSVRSFKTATATSCTGCPHQLYDLSLTLGGNPPRSGGVVDLNLLLLREVYAYSLLLGTFGSVTGVMNLNLFHHLGR